MSRLLKDLNPMMRGKAVELLARLTEANIPVIIVCTLRSYEEHQKDLANGTSKITLSMHLPGKMRGRSFDGSDAIDICPYSIYNLHGSNKLQWDSTDPVWDKIGIIGEALKLRWGGRWKSPHDPGHFEDTFL
jgi:hypothetical protein